MTHDQCKDLFRAGKTLLEKSELVLYDGQSFESRDDYDDLEKRWNNLDPEFGRYMAWIWFSVGAENLVKAACVCNGIIKRKTTKLGYPLFDFKNDRSHWITNVLNPQKGEHGSEEAQKYDFGTLGDIWNRKLDKLSEKCGIPPDQREELKVAYKYLTEAIRNRDGHSYIENRRKKDFPAVKGVFVLAFNTLVGTMRDNGHSP